MTMKDADGWTDEASEMTAAACLFQSFSDSSRLVILRHLQLGEHRVVDLTEHLRLSQSTVSKHLASLKETGLVVSRPEGRASIYSIQHPEALVELFAAAERYLALTGESVKLCAKHQSERRRGSSA
ncbi:MAG: metalloregulator ArsR/SmtB family transcription factor [Candidatus Nanopelagicales bacterium]|uniref:ArsR/SmtB family transcription factor n=1 Tax=Rhodococcus pyridinivorans TaxID=103816 RepID=UPI00265A5131|nr:metalloregulator ArsR/SmtB family transcription factor [Rhodococcus pyridinivorans]MCO5299336.1 metalloregulator ArsR/SmtB family transcription factor [Candidatus Nanopelagicales bacterium]HPE11211.1 metalloregulator ArsR/SmtB family transcription factor [Actinomycetota bacterium]HRV64732.1 metalloregulator ArsR/SmtB family transcription factor [Candidatus Nanopelagicales bacterium]